MCIGCADDDVTDTDTDTDTADPCPATDGAGGLRTAELAAGATTYLIPHDVDFGTVNGCEAWCGPAADGVVYAHAYFGEGGGCSVEAPPPVDMVTAAVCLISYPPSDLVEYSCTYSTSVGDWALQVRALD